MLLHTINSLYPQFSLFHKSYCLRVQRIFFFSEKSKAYPLQLEIDAKVRTMQVAPERIAKECVIYRQVIYFVSQFTTLGNTKIAS